MSGKKTGFMTGARAKVKLGNHVLAFCTDVSYNVTVQTIPVEAMGKFEVFSNEPIGYMVDGSFSIIRYTSKMAAYSGVTDQEAAGTNMSGNDSTTPNTLPKGTAPSDHMNPSKILSSMTLDLIVLDKATAGATDVGIIKLTDCRITRKGAALNKRGVLVDNYSFVAILADDAEVSGTDTAIGNSSMAS